MTRVVRASCALYKVLLFMYPGDFRLRFASEMVTTFSDLISGEWERKGRLGVARVWRREVFLPLCHFNCGSIVAATSRAVLSSFALFMVLFYAMALALAVLCVAWAACSALASVVSSGLHGNLSTSQRSEALSVPRGIAEVLLDSRRDLLCCAVRVHHS